MISVNIPKSAMNDVYLPYLENQARTQIYFGGSSSGKSKFIVGQRVVYQLLQGGRNFLICRQTKTSIRGSVATEIAKVIGEWGLSNLFSINKTDGTVTCKNGYQAAFAGLDDVERLKSLAYLKGVLTDVVVEEATEVEQKSVKQLTKRQRGKVQKDIKKTITLLFNPILKAHWIYKEHFEKIGWTENQTEFHNDRLSILKTTYKDNRFLEQGDIDDLENETDEYFYNVYTLGNWGVLGDVIFRNWKVADLNNPDDPYYLPETQRTNIRRGGDFGFAGHPAAFGVSHYDKMRKRIYCYKELYETGLTNDVLAQRIKDMGEATGRSVWDSAEPKSIQELCNHGVNATGARKGKDSIRQGINWLKQQEIIVDKSLINLQNELSQYHWKKDAGGNDLNPPIPVDKNNHLLDGMLRYAYEGDMIENKIEIVENPFFD
jgi:phage terminase large subunit